MHVWIFAKHWLGNGNEAAHLASKLRKSSWPLRQRQRIVVQWQHTARHTWLVWCLHREQTLLKNDWIQDSVFCPGNRPGCQSKGLLRKPPGIEEGWSVGASCLLPYLNRNMLVSRKKLMHENNDFFCIYMSEGTCIYGRSKDLYCKKSD